MRDVLQRDINFYGRAANLAVLSDYSTRVGCLAAKGNRLLAGAFNTIRSTPRNTAYGGATFHAEHNCLGLLSDSDFPRTTIYVARLGRSAQQLPSRPCVRCMLELVDKGIREVVYLDKHHRIVKEYW